jgi:hypothetical protein
LKKLIVDGLAVFQQNSIGFFRELPRYLPGARYLQEDGLFFGITGWNLSAFNNAFILDECQVLPDHVERIREIFAADELPFSVMVYSRERVPMCDGLLKEHGYFDIFTDQVMICEGQLLPRHPNTEVDIHEVTNAAEQTDFLEVVVNAFDLPSSLPTEIFNDLLHIPLFHPMIGYLDDRPVGSGMLLCCQDIAAVYNVGTITAMRNRGIGTAMVTALHQRALAIGFNATVLASTPTGYSLYQQLGYRLDGYQITYAPTEYLNGP